MHNLQDTLLGAFAGDHFVDDFLEIGNCALPNINDYPYEYLNRHAKITNLVRRQRSEYRKTLLTYLIETSQIDYHWDSPSVLEKIKSVGLLLSSSRGGSSVTYALLRCQAVGQHKDRRLLLSIPGEQKPHLAVTGYWGPESGNLYDDLNEEDLNFNNQVLYNRKTRKEFLTEELISEIGYPLAETTDFFAYSLRIFGRLLLQWPEIDFGQIADFQTKIIKELENVTSELGTPGLYQDTIKYRTAIMLKLHKHFPRMNILYYDGLNREIVQKMLAGYPKGKLSDIQFGESPFIVPSPWKHATSEELARATLLLKDPSDCWRLNFWQSLFSHADIKYLHLTRDPRATIKGLYDGWQYQYGFQTIPSPKPLSIIDYSDLGVYSRQFFQFSTPETLLKCLFLGKAIPLEAVGAIQWTEAHKAMIGAAKKDPDRYWKIQSGHESEFGFEWICRKPLEAAQEICRHLKVETSESLLRFAENFSSHAIVVTPGAKLDPFRWKSAGNRDRIEAVANSDYVRETAKCIGYNY